MHLRSSQPGPGLGCAALALAFVLLSAACGAGAIAACSDEPDVSGGWTLSVSPEPADAGVAATLPGTFTIDAELTQGAATSFLDIGYFVYGTLTASDPSYFGTLSIPKLTNNDGSKTGAILGCKLSINVPIATPVTDDDTDQGPLRISLQGGVSAPGQLTGSSGSMLIMADDASQTSRSFLWTGARK